MGFMTMLLDGLDLAATAMLFGGLIYITKAIRVREEPDISKSLFLRGGGFLILFVAVKLLTGMIA